jgi:hypothetical protein
VGRVACAEAYQEPCCRLYSMAKRVSPDLERAGGPSGIILWDSLRYPSHLEALGLSSVGSALVVDSQVDSLVIMVSNSGSASVSFNPDL